MKPKLILFNFSGTLDYLAKPVDFKEFFTSLKKFGIEIITEKEIKAFTTLFADLLGWAKDWFDFSKKIFLEFVEKPKRKQVEKLARFLEKNIVFKLYDDISEIYNLPVKKAILSGNAKLILETLDLERFTKIFTPKETKFLKPDKRAFLMVLKKLKTKPKETLMVGDEIERDLIPAKDLGMETILIDRENKIKNPPVKKINSLKELKKFLI
jgi:putative hydrolase of the HAD superfamily